MQELKIDSDERFKTMLKESYIDPSQPQPEPPIVFSKGYYYDGMASEKPIPICTKGNFSFIYAEEKRKKTFLVSLFSMAYLNPKCPNIGDICVHDNTRNIVHFDTEQSKYHAHRVFNRAYRVSKNRNKYITFGLRNYNWKERLDFIDRYLYEYDNNDFVIIDGVADICKDSNDKEASEEISQKLMTWTQELDLHIMTIIHANPKSDKAKGHLGTSLGAKCETKMFLDVVDDSVIVNCKSSRNYGFEDFAFNVGRDGLPIILDEIPEKIDNDKFLRL